MKTRQQGYIGETLAAQFLQSKGYEILDSNVTFRGGEIDLIVRTETMPFIFVEVKTRKSVAFGEGDESITRTKMQRLQYAIERYLQTASPHADAAYRIDVIDIKLDSVTGDLSTINHIEDIDI